MTQRTFLARMLAGWIGAFLVTAISLNASAHPMHSQAIERPCTLHQKAAPASLIEARCSFFLATGYLVFKLDPVSGDEGAESASISGAINLSQSTGSIFHAGNGQLANGAVTVADSSPRVVHMKPGELATWDNGYVLEVRGTPTAADGAAGTAAQQNAGMLAQQNTETLVEVVTNYIELGFLHIIPLGFDHILFIIGLFLLSPNLKTLLWQVSAFTLAHTVTLALGATAVVQLSAVIVEPLIALSIVWIAVENLLTNKLHRWRIVVVFCFGLLHGLGFAGVLLDIGLFGAHFYSSLLAFNVGVELGQLAVITLCFLTVGWARQHADYHRRVVVPASYVIAIIAAFWVFQRADLINIATS